MNGSEKIENINYCIAFHIVPSIDIQFKLKLEILPINTPGENN